LSKASGGNRTHNIRFTKAVTDNSKPLSKKDLQSNDVVEIAPQIARSREIPPDLAQVINAWLTLPDALKAGIVAMVKAAKEAM